MRIWKKENLMKSFELNGDNCQSCNKEWYIDSRKYGSVPHGGFGLGIERFICWMLDIHDIRDACLFPRLPNTCKP